MRCLAGCFGLSVTNIEDSESDECKRTSGVDGEGRPVTGGRRAEAVSCEGQLDLSCLVALLTGEVAHGDWWDILQSAATALAMRLTADHASIFMMAGAGVAALATSGVPLFGLRLGQLLLPHSSYSTGTSSEDSSQLAVTPSDMDVCILAAALQNQTASVPIVFRSVEVNSEQSPLLGRQPNEDQQKQQQLAPAQQQRTPPGAGPAPGAACGRGYGYSESGDLSPVGYKQQQQHRLKHQRSTASATATVSASGSALGDPGSNLRHFVAVAIPGGKSAAGMFILSGTGPSPPAAWRAEGLGMVAALLAPLLRPPQVPLARRTLAELHAASTINQLVHALSAAAADLMMVAVRVALQPRVALLRNDGTAAAVFAVPESVPVSGPSVCRRRSRDVVLVDAGGSGYGCNSFKAPDFFMLGQPSLLERDSLGTCATGGVGAPAAVGIAGGGTGGGIGPCGGTLGNKTASALGTGPGCRGQSLPLQHTLLAEALARGSGLCIADCNAYVQDSKAFPRDLMVFSRGVGGAAPAQSLALATSCHNGKPLLALYATYHSILPQALLQTVVQELGQLLRALTPTVATLLLPGGPMAEEWSLLHDDLLGPESLGICTTSTTSRLRTSNPTALPSQAQAAAAAVAGAITAAATVGAETPRSGARPRPVLTVAAAVAANAGGGGGAGDRTVGVVCDLGGGSVAASPTVGGGRSTRSARSATGGPPGSPLGGVVAQVGALFRRHTANGGGRPHTNRMAAADRPTAAVAAAETDVVGRAATTLGRVTTPSPNEAAVLTAMTAAAAVLSDPAANIVAIDGSGDAPTSASKRLAAFVSGGPPVTPGGAASGATPVAAGLRSGMSRTALAHSHTGRTSFSLEAAGSPRGGVRLAPLITTLHDRLKSAQAEQLTASSRAASRMQDLESLRFLERVGKGGYGSVYRGLYHGSEVAIKVVEDPTPALGQLPGGAGTAAGEGKSPTTAAAAAAAAVTLRSKHLHDAIELVASVSMSHPNIVQLITYFVDVRAQYHHRNRGIGEPCGTTNGTEANAAGGSGGGDGGRHGGGGGGDGESGMLQLVHMTSSGMNSTNSSFTESGGNEAIVLVMEYCDRGSLKDAIHDGSFLHREALAQMQMLHRQQQHQQQHQHQQQQPHQHQQQQPHQQQQQHAQAQPMLPRSCVQLVNMKAVYSTLLEVALALRHMHGLHMVHCDLKPQNVLLKSSPRDPRGFTAKLSDFGLAKMMAHDDDGQLVISEGIQSGTITHLPPEALQGRRQLGPAVDVYAFGIVMFQMLCGMTVYRGLDVKQIIRGVVRHSLRPVFPPWVPAEYRELAQRCWHEQLSCRPSSLQLVSELESLLEACDAPGLLPGRRPGGSIGAVRSAVGGHGAAASRRRLPPRCATETSILQAKRPVGATPAAATPASPRADGGAVPEADNVGNDTAGAAAAAVPTPAAAVPVAAAAVATAAMAIAPPPAPTQQPSSAAAAAPAPLSHPPFFLYQPPQQLYQLSSLEPRPPASPFSTAAGTVPGAAPPLPQPLTPPIPAASALPAAAPSAYPGGLGFVLPMFGSNGGAGGGGGGGRVLGLNASLAATPSSLQSTAQQPLVPQPPSLYTRSPCGVAAQTTSQPPPTPQAATAAAPCPEPAALMADPVNCVWSDAVAPRAAALMGSAGKSTTTASTASAAATGPAATPNPAGFTAPRTSAGSTPTSPAAGAAVSPLPVELHLDACGPGRAEAA